MLCVREREKRREGRKEKNSRLHVPMVQRGWACVGTSEGACEKESWRGRMVGEE